MARSISEIKRTMTDAFMQDEAIRDAYGISPDKTRFADCFSAVSLENLLFYIVAACHYVLESIFEKFTQDVEQKISRAVVASIPWYFDKAKAFQYGDALVLNPRTFGYEYAKVDTSKQLVKYVAVRDRGASIEMLVSAEQDGKPTPLQDDFLTAFKHYINAIKIAGVVINVRTRKADELSIAVKVVVDPLKINRQGVDIASSEKVVEHAIENYLADIVYGGTFNKTKLVDAIQRVDGVVDVALGVCKYKAGDEFKEIAGNNYTAVGGSFIAVGLDKTIEYVV
nr:MAG TPA: secretion system protein [Caudoviricetes sp.]